MMNYVPFYAELLAADSVINVFRIMHGMRNKCDLFNNFGPPSIEKFAVLS